ncbi:hypothetical protein J7L00_03715 [Candidatus Bathyarchaeota archaeon]|nr:hypothetical protein [Candidatus Bathyarchaeota archaeon]
MEIVEEIEQRLILRWLRFREKFDLKRFIKRSRYFVVYAITAFIVFLFGLST